MMQVIIAVNNRKIRTIDIIRVDKTPAQLQGKTFDYVWHTTTKTDGPPTLGELQGHVSHNYDDGAEVLVQKVLEQICT